MLEKKNRKQNTKNLCPRKNINIELLYAGNIRIPLLKKRKIRHKRENRRGNQEWTIQRHQEQKTKDK